MTPNGGCQGRHVAVGPGGEIKEQTVKNHLSNAMRKLALHDRTMPLLLRLAKA